jgi:hypothetical protein
MTNKEGINQALFGAKNRKVSFIIKPWLSALLETKYSYFRVLTNTWNILYFYYLLF